MRVVYTPRARAAADSRLRVWIETHGGLLSRRRQNWRGPHPVGKGVKRLRGRVLCGSPTKPMLTRAVVKPRRVYKVMRPLSAKGVPFYPRELRGTSGPTRCRTCSVWIRWIVRYQHGWADSLTNRARRRWHRACPVRGMPYALSLLGLLTFFGLLCLSSALATESVLPIRVAGQRRGKRPRSSRARQYSL